MGHDVIAFKCSTEEIGDIANAELRKRIESGSLGSFDEFRNQLAEKTVATAMRRSAFDRYNKIIYMLCDAEFTYGGWSGNQGESWMTREEVDHALAQIEHMRETGIPALSDEEIQGMKDRMQDSADKPYDTGVTLHLYKVDPQTGEKIEMTEDEKKDALANFITEDGEWGSTLDDNLESEYRFFTEIKSCMDKEGLDQVRVWFG